MPDNAQSPPIHLELNGAHLSDHQKQAAQSAILKTIATHVTNVGNANPAAIGDPNSTVFKLKWRDANPGGNFQLSPTQP